MQVSAADKAESLDGSAVNAYWWRHNAYVGMEFPQKALEELRKAFKKPYKRMNYNLLMKMRKVITYPTLTCKFKTPRRRKEYKEFLNDMLKTRYETVYPA